ncbi:DHH family phosphoesterase [Elusimicrobiota bacterium]
MPNNILKIITTHTGADFDALSSLIAASKLYPDAYIFIPGSPERKVREYLDSEYFPGNMISYGEMQNENLELLVIVDTRYLSRLGRIREFITDETEIHMYDHHPRTEEDMKGDVDVMKNYGATTTILVEKIIESQIEINPGEATLLALGIYEDTGCLTYPLTTSSDMDIVSYLMKSGANLRTISKYAVHEINEEQVSLLDTLLKSKSFIKVGSDKVAFMHAAINDYIEELAVVVHRAMDIINPDALFVFIEIQSKILCISRSKSEDINVGVMLTYFRGGGHPTAASATFLNTDYNEVKKKMVAYLEKNIAKTEGLPMIKKSAKVIPHYHTAETAYHTLTHLNLEYAPVGDIDGSLAGCVQKAELDKAVRHGMAEHGVTEFITMNVPSADESEDPKNISKKLASSGFDFLVMKKDSVITGLIEKKESSIETIVDDAGEPSYELVRSKLENNLSQGVLEILELAVEIADQMGIGVFCVGGMVRDIIMDKKHKDIDLVVEKHGIEFGEKLAKKLDGHISTHRKFNTAVIKLPDREIDVATLRKEYYEFPAALPLIEKGTLKQDLYRRDFTVNAMAIQLNPEEECGKLIDYFGGRKDLQKKIIRILYPLSFIEDPTRIFRAIRFEKRFGFVLSAETLSQLKKTVSMDIHSYLTSDRVKEEIIMILKEPDPHEIFLRLDELGVLNSIHSSLKITDNIYNTIKEYNNVVEGLPEGVKEEVKKRQWTIMLLILISELEKETGKKVLEGFHFSLKYISIYLEVKEYSQKIINLLNKDISNARIYKALNFLKEDVLFYIICTASDKKVEENIVKYLNEIKNIKISTCGKDLKEMGFKTGPIFSEILNTLKMARINCIIENADQEKDFIKKNFVF